MVTKTRLKNESKIRQERKATKKTRVETTVEAKKKGKCAQNCT